MRERPIQVAIFGGGCAGITTAFELSRPEHAGKFEVTVYQLGWRLGGKGASGRGAADRIEEHGLHLWMGFYENAFRLMRECYAELAQQPRKQRFADWTDAFKPDPFCGVMDRVGRGEWEPWSVHLPTMSGTPGDPNHRPSRWTMLGYLSRSVQLLRTLIEAVRARSGDASHPVSPLPAAEPVLAVTRLLQLGAIASLSAVIESIYLLDQIISGLPNYPTDLALKLHEAITRAARQQIEALVQRDLVVRRLWEVADLVLATIRGIIRSGLLTDPRGFEAIDDYDCREWLRMHGASERALDSALLRGLYDLAFAYEDGDVKRPAIAAGQALRGAVRAFFDYRGAFFYKMQAGMGDVVFSPFYQVLEQRGVRFEFFHRLQSLRLSPKRAAGQLFSIDAIELDVQAEIRGGRAYEPLVDVHGLPCWSAAPDWKQLVDGARLQREGWDFESHWDTRHAAKKTLQVGKDFDLAVLAVGPGAVPFVCSELVERIPRWRDMVRNTKHVATQALQLWLSADTRALGWTRGPVNLTGYVEPFDTWADMSHLCAEESFTAKVKSIAYFCSVLPNAPAEQVARADHPEQQRAQVRRHALRFIKRDLKRLWPKCIDAQGVFRWDLLVAPEDLKVNKKPQDERRIDTQYFRANVNPSDRYSLSLPGTLKYRISPLDTGVDNLTVAGDWTDCGFNEGCVEAAVMSGRLAAHALSELPKLEDIVGFDHP